MFAAMAEWKAVAVNSRGVVTFPRRDLAFSARSERPSPENRHQGPCLAGISSSKLGSCELGPSSRGEIPRLSRHDVIYVEEDEPRALTDHAPSRPLQDSLRDGHLRP